MWPEAGVAVIATPTTIPSAKIAITRGFLSRLVPLLNSAPFLTRRETLPQRPLFTALETTAFSPNFKGNLLRKADGYH
jgi:hypothetical protein